MIGSLVNMANMDRLTFCSHLIISLSTILAAAVLVVVVVITKWTLLKLWVDWSVGSERLHIDPHIVWTQYPGFNTRLRSGAFSGTSNTSDLKKM